ncbi:MAG: hypothetical protein KC464_26325 [Myxococcales bacterium]|nr:hypothetical protein [Myxococcales bacterium]
MRALAMVASVVFLTAGCERRSTAPAASPGDGHPAAVTTAIDAGGAASDAAPVDLALGRWELGYHRFCVEVFADHTIEVAVQGERDREPVRIGGRYLAVPTGADAYRVTIASPELRQKQLTRCRKSWADMPVPARELLGVVARRGEPLTLTLRPFDDGDHLEVCGAPGQCVVLDRKEPSGRDTALDER